jgi:FkbM family methyltransferase
MTFYDIGAHIGFFSLLAARIVGPFGHVISFEADPEVAARLRENLARNGFDQATVVQKAVWSEPTTVFLCAWIRSRAADEANFSWSVIASRLAGLLME